MNNQDLLFYLNFTLMFLPYSLSCIMATNSPERCTLSVSMSLISSSSCISPKPNLSNANWSSSAVMYPLPSLSKYEKAAYI
ncbi:hypothetical protein HanXRQr2_Chr01g0038841 [Helianthus annuus]|uniref:Uncharacterized protein n=1 Tax=Helianthus annuus TaxID=4232 RepID=A0A9K3JYB2_HELAN|nr:hypothetical protein HanXRQr2_Chr01g0038841 [Helianthus annuus]